MMHYAKRLGIALEPFFQVNYNAYIHSSQAFGGKPQRFRESKPTIRGMSQNCWPRRRGRIPLTPRSPRKTKRYFLESLREWGALDKNFAYVASEAVSDRRGYEKNPGGGLNGKPIPSKPLRFAIFSNPASGRHPLTATPFDMQTSLFSARGGMGRIGEAFAENSDPSFATTAK